MGSAEESILMRLGRIKNWSKFQHFKDRRPPWIKLYRDILDDRQWHQLDGDAAKCLVMIWLIASEDDGQIPAISDLAFRLRKSDQEVEGIVSKLSHWMEHDDNKVISRCYQDDAPEGEREVETEFPNLSDERLGVPASGDPEAAEELQDGSNGPEIAERKRCPTAEIVALYHAELPQLARVEKMTDARAGYIRQRWLQDLPTLDAWRNYFADVKRSKFLMGLAPGRDGKPPFVADLEWLTRPSNFAKVSEGKYHR